MKTWRLIPLLVPTCTILSFAAGGVSDRDLLATLRNLDSLTRVTKERGFLTKEFSSLCGPPGPTGHATFIRGKDAGIHIYVTSENAAAFREDKFPFPEGTIILKEKFPSYQGTVPELYTGMLKREAGYNPRAGDWEFFTLSGDRKVVTARGRIDSCMDCHQYYAKSDFVAKQYAYGRIPTPAGKSDLSKGAQ